MTTEQLALELDLPRPAVPDYRPPCAECGAPALAHVYGFGPRDAAKRRNADKFVTYECRDACRDHIEPLTAEVRDATVAQSPTAYLIVWSHLHQPGDPDSRLPGTEYSWHEVERVER